MLQVTGTTFTSQDALASSTARLTVEIAPESVNIQYEHITVSTGEVRRRRRIITDSDDDNDGHVAAECEGGCGGEGDLCDQAEQPCPCSGLVPGGHQAVHCGADQCH